jgi:superfamily II DNA/RNA helicase
MSFEELGLSPEVLRAIADVGYTTPTPIQKQAIPYVLQSRDVLGCAQTGTGKTASFTLPMIEILANGRTRARMPRSVILEPTRELAAQVAENFKTYGKYTKLSMALLIGGESMDDQRKALDRGVDVLIATPGRMLDLYERGNVMLNDIKIFVIDEADRMLDMGFIPDIERIAAMIPSIRQTLFFSATMPPEIKRLADKFLMNPKEITVSPPASVTTTVTHHVAVLPEIQKRQALRNLLKSANVQNAFIFCNRKRDVAILETSLKRHGFSAAALHGDMTQTARNEALDAFRQGKVALLVCSDVAARGLDIADVSHVFNFDVPFNAEDYVHRIGRTGRAGKTGVAYTLATQDDYRLVKAIEKLIGTSIAPLTLDGIDNLPLEEPPEGSSRGRGRGKGGSSGGGRGGKSNPAHVSPPPRAHAPKPSEHLAHPVHTKHPAKPAPLQGMDTTRHREDVKPRYDADDDHGPTPTGFGDNLPAFMKRGK